MRFRVGDIVQFNKYGSILEGKVKHVGTSSWSHRKGVSVIVTNVIDTSKKAEWFSGGTPGQRYWVATYYTKVKMIKMKTETQKKYKAMTGAKITAKITKK